MAEPVLGIDFGTSFCRVAVAESRGKRVVPRLLFAGQVPAAFPSVVSVDPMGVCLAGEEARRLVVVEPGWVIHGAKRLLRGGEGDGGAGAPVLARSDWGGPRCETEPSGSVLFRVGAGGTDPEASAQDVSPLRAVTAVLRLARETAGQALGLPVARCVIGVPPVFGPGEREMMARAAAEAGLDVLGLIDEGLAVTLAHCATAKGKHRHDARRHFLTVDVGGGFTGMTLVQTDGHHYREMAVTGTRLGGEEIEHRLAQYLVEEYRRIPGWPVQEPSVLGHVRQMAGAAMVRLSEEESLPVVLYHGGRTFASLLSRSQVERLGEDIARCLRETLPQLWFNWGPCAGSGKQEIRLPVIVPAGGLVRLAFIQRALKTALPGAEVVAPMPAESVAQGAALWGWALVSGDEGTDEATGALRTASVAPWTIAVGRSAGEPAVLVRAGSSLPCRAVCEKISLGEPGESRAILRLLEAPGVVSQPAGGGAAFRPFAEVRVEVPGSPKSPAGQPAEPGAAGTESEGSRLTGRRASLALTLTADGRMQVLVTEEASGHAIPAGLWFYGVPGEDAAVRPEGVRA